MPLKFPRKSPCDWVGRRLSLFVGGELPSAERRVVERHLIVCEQCRTCETSRQRAFEALKTAAGIAPASLLEHDAPLVSLWPNLARQIQDSKHAPVPRALSWEGVTFWLEETWAGFSESLAGLGRSLAAPSLVGFRVVPVVMAALVLVSVTVFGVGSWVRWTENRSQSELAAAARPIVTPDFSAFPRARGPALPSDDATFVRNEASASKPERVSTSSRLNYDLDHGTPMGPHSLDLKPSY